MRRTAFVVAGIVLLFWIPLQIGIWLPDVLLAPRHVLAEQRSPSGEIIRVIQYWNRVDFYSTELEFVDTDGKAQGFTLDGDDSKSWSVPLIVDWNTKIAQVTLVGGPLRTVDLKVGKVEW
jgi:hypothetical protein